MNYEKDITLQKIRNPRKYDHVIDYPGEFDAAELLLSQWNDLSAKDKERVSAILIHSGRYI